MWDMGITTRDFMAKAGRHTIVLALAWAGGRCHAQFSTPPAGLRASQPLDGLTMAPRGRRAEHLGVAERAAMPNQHQGPRQVSAVDVGKSHRLTSSTASIVMEGLLQQSGKKLAQVPALAKLD